ncbi:MAG: biotin-dependent carboxyltransferase family protein [Thermovirgaceae bacterium]|nr:biotin-dependent carboxyltransferase family protein [Thermovirgaceae bacterium]
MITVLAPGLLTTVQDLGRWGFQAFGMPVAGAMDVYSLMAGNAVVGNIPGAAGLEITLTGPELRFDSPGLACVAGGDLGPLLNGFPVSSWEGIRVSEGDVLSFRGAASGGARAWVCVGGGVDVPLVMGSRSTYLRGGLGGHEGRRLKRDDVLPCGNPDTLWPRGEGFCVPSSLRPQVTGEPQVRVIPGPQEDMFSPEGVDSFYNSGYSVGSESDRMGYRLEGPAVEHSNGADIISDAVAQGSIQVPGHGFPIVMLADRQTTGGYPKIATVINADLQLLSQMAPGDGLTFRRVQVSEAAEASRKMMEALRTIRSLAADYRSRPAKYRGRSRMSGNMRLCFGGDCYDVSWSAFDGQGDN